MSFHTARDERPREAILLVAGTGSRLRPLTDDRPKCLLKVGEQSLLRRLLKQLEAVGVERVVLATGYLQDRLVDEVRSWDLSMEIDAVFNETFASENNAVSLGAAMKGLNGERFLLCDGDILLRTADALEQLLDFPGDNVLTMMRFEAMGEEEMKMVLASEDGRIDRLGKGLSLDVADGESLGIQKIGPTAFTALAERLADLDEEERRHLYYEDVFSELIEEGILFYACDLPPEGWTEIDTVEDLEKARQMAIGW
jgi:choline kinase